MKLELKMYKINEFKFINKLEPNTEIRLENGFSYNVKYATNNTCKGTIEVNVFDESKSKFVVKLVLEGIFAFEDKARQEDIHKASFREIYAYAKSIIITLTANAGIPPIFIPPVDINSQSIYKISGESN